MAQSYGLPPADVGGGRDYSRTGGQDEASLVLRLERLENQVRQLNGQLEQAQFENRRLEEQLRKFEQDVEFRFQEAGRGKPPPQKRGDLDIPAPTTQAAIPAADPAMQTTTPGGLPPRTARRSDAFDPASDPSAPGAPRPLGGPSSSSSIGASPGTLSGPPSPANVPTAAAKAPGRADLDDDDDPSAPLELSSSPGRSARQTAEPAPITTPGGTIIANNQPNTASPSANPVKEEFDAAIGFLKLKEYDAAEKSLSAFLQKNPKTRYSAEAIYDLGETYYMRGRQREAAEQYLKISTDYATSARAPEAMIRLGQSLHAIGAKEQACAAFGEVARKYPNASAPVKALAEREAKRLQC